MTVHLSQRRCGQSQDSKAASGRRSWSSWVGSRYTSLDNDDVVMESGLSKEDKFGT